MRRLIAVLASSLATTAFASESCGQKQCVKNPKEKGCHCGMGGQGHGKGHGMRHGDGEAEAHGFMKAMGKLGLTDDQKKQMEAIHAEFAARHHNPESNMKPEDMAADHRNMIERMRALLTEEQKKKLAEVMGAK